MKNYREPAVAGLFYPGKAETLLNKVRNLLAGCRPEAERPVKFLIVPHAGYEYSGKIAAQAYVEISSGRFKKVILIGASHRRYFTGAAAPEELRWRSPLGDAVLDPVSGDGIVKDSECHEFEHSLEVQLPFLQYLLPETTITPLLLSGPRSQAEKLAKTLISHDEQDVLWVISSDFTHGGPGFQYYPESFGFESGEAMDFQAIKYITDGKVEEFGEFLEETGATICGALPIMTAMFMIRMLNLPNFKLKSYDSSGRQTGDPTSVGYAALYCQT